MRRSYKRDARGRFASTGGGRKGRRAAKRKARARAYVKRANAFTRSERRYVAANKRAGATVTPAPPGRLGRALQAHQSRKDRKMERRSGLKIIR